MTNGSGFQVSGDVAQRYERVSSEYMMPCAQHLVGVADVAAGERVLDLACGTGFVARTAKAAVDPDGSVVGVDVNPLMVQEGVRVTGLDLREASADDTGLPTSCVDVVLCQQGLQFFPDKQGALREVMRVLVVGGRAAFSVWDVLDHNPFLARQIDAFESVFGTEEVAALKGISITALGGVAGFAALLVDAGFENVVVEPHGFEVQLPPIAQYLPALMAATPWADAFAGLASSDQERAMTTIKSAVTETESGCTAPLGLLIATATRPSGQ